MTKTLAAIALTITALLSTTACNSIVARTATVHVYVNEDLSDAGYTIPANTVTIERSAGTVCYITGATSINGGQLYTACK